jgi:uncharacterized protein YkwD
MRVACVISVVFCISVFMGCAASSGLDNKSLQCESAKTIQREMVQRINAVRSSPRQCGTTLFPIVSPIAWNTPLARAAHTHAKDMAAGDFLAHRGSDGSVADTRVKAVGYAWQTVGENVAAGYATSQQTIRAWLDSAEHCANMMDPSFTEIGAACVRHKTSHYGTYWTLVLASQSK